MTLYNMCWCSSNFTWISTMHLKFFHISSTILWKCLEKLLSKCRNEATFLQTYSVDSLQSKKRIFSEDFWTLIHKVRKYFTYEVLICVKLELCRIKCVEMRAKTVLQVKLHYFQCNFGRLHVFPKFTCCYRLNCQIQYCSILWIFSKCSGISEIFPPVWALRVHRSP